MSYRAPLGEFAFVLNDYLGIAGLGNLPGFSDTTPDLLAAILGEIGKFAEEKLYPLNASADREGCTYDPASKTVRTPAGFKAAHRAFVEAGWPRLSADPEYGGQALPVVIATAAGETLTSANWAFTMYAGVGNGAYSAIKAHGSEEQKSLYLPKLASGQWSGTMHLTEPQAGTDLGLMRTTAEPSPDGSYRINGTKIFISGGEQDITENIVHLVLAKIPGGPPGSRGISLFIVPKFLVNPDGSLGKRNTLSCGGLEHKMGINGSATCVMNYENAAGFLVGEPHKGLRAMFTMMNEARLAVGLQGLAIAEVAYQNAAAYAKERLQGRSISGAKNPDGPADPIIVHPDVRRMLMEARCFTEGARAFILWIALKVDLEMRASDAKEREAAGDLVALLTPVIKAYCSDQGFQTAVKCQQVFGGHGYIKEYPAEQFVRDARIAMIYEGANGIQAMDLVGRKLAQNNGRALGMFFGEIDHALEDAKGDVFLKPWADGLTKAKADMQGAIGWLMQNALTRPEHAGAGANDFLYLTALTTLAYIWLGLVKTAKAKLDAGTGDKAFCEAKIAVGRFFLARVLPDTSAHLAKLTSGADTVMALAADAF
ncbi:MAG TPA: acyl-CoA dehydrogenase C-terminal domain-containing protein [Alphaproteobacteria bacterium]|nr:acyl-CoA dehydrogenase C-terminal domain-containing protein [Alphaproteobacteria bacterium]